MKKSPSTKFFALALAVLVTFLGFPLAGVFAEDEPTVYVGTGEELDAAIKAAVTTTRTNIILTADIDAITSATYGHRTATNENAIKFLSIDGQGHTISDAGNVDGNTALRFQSSAANTDLIFKNIVFEDLQSNISYGGGALGIFHGTVVI
ncbi:MAG: hypothetical protein LBQ16_07255, partial [Gracilibacteraceae bacterium]|nr:hypothetical protein [Gracilibacteraceae bacterium]